MTYTAFLGIVFLGRGKKSKISGIPVMKEQQKMNLLLYGDFFQEMILPDSFYLRVGVMSKWNADLL
jgi:hypothetical protein